MKRPATDTGVLGVVDAMRLAAGVLVQARRKSVALTRRHDNFTPIQHRRLQLAIDAAERAGLKPWCYRKPRR